MFATLFAVALTGQILGPRSQWVPGPGYWERGGAGATRLEAQWLADRQRLDAQVPHSEIPKQRKHHAALSVVPKPPVPIATVRATTLLSLGHNWEANGKPELALENYRELLAKYPNSAQAKTAKDRIAALSRYASR